VTNLPSGTVAFLMSDIEGSTRLASVARERFPALLDAHFGLVRGAIEKQAGTFVSSEGDSVFAVFPTARAAVVAAVAAQRDLAAHSWPAGSEVRVRMGVHVGEAVFGGRDYTGIDVHKAARIMAAAWGGQIICSQAVETLVGDALDDHVSFLDLGVHSLRDIPDPERLFQVVAPGLRADFPPPRTESAAARTNLPSPLTRFVGRAREIEDVRRLIAEERLVTLTGPGGTGKTRLAIEVGRVSLGSFPDGVYFVALESVRDPDLVVAQIGQALGLLEDSTRPIADALAAYLAGKHVLLVLDNIEQVIGAAPRIAQLVSAAPQLVVLGSSREPLGVAGETVYPVPTLALPAQPGHPSATQVARMEAVELFVERARAARPDFALTDENAAAVAAICRRIDGLPLAIELAAARINVLTPAQILTRLDHRLTLLAGSRRDVPDRQQSLRGAIDWSYELLSDDEKKGFRRFSVFAGGADLDAALAVLDPESALATDPIDLLSALVARSLLRSSTEEDAARFSMLETIREYALERLADSDERAQVYERHGNHYVAVAAAAHDVLLAPDRDAILGRLDLDMPNFRVAFDWMIANNRADLAAGAAAGLTAFWRTRSHLAEACALLERVLRDLSFGSDEAARAKVLTAAAELANWRGDYQRASEWTNELLELLERRGDKAGLAQAYHNVGWSNIAANPEAARDGFERAVQAGRELDDAPLLLGAEQGLAIALFRTGEPERARAAALAAIDVGNAIRDPYSNSFNMLTLGFIELNLGDQVSCAHRFTAALESAVAAQADVGIITALDAISWLMLERGDVKIAARLSFTAERMRNEIGGAPTMELVGVGRTLDRVRERDEAMYLAVAAETPLTKEAAIDAAHAALAAIAEG